jgi:hypothetical protein
MDFLIILFSFAVANFSYVFKNLKDIYLYKKNVPVLLTAFSFTGGIIICIVFTHLLLRIL